MTNPSYAAAVQRNLPAPDNLHDPALNPNTQTNLSYWYECVNPNLNPTEELLASLESRDDEEDDSIF